MDLMADIECRGLLIRRHWEVECK